MRQGRQYGRHAPEAVDLRIAQCPLVLVAIEIDGKHTAVVLVLDDGHALGHAVRVVDQGAVLAFHFLGRDVAQRRAACRAGVAVVPGAVPQIRT